MASEKTEQRYKQFAQTYVTNGRNATQAYLTISPDAAYETCRTEGAAYLAKPRIQEHIQELERQVSKKLEITAETLLAELDEIKANTPDSRVKVLTIQEQAKLLGLYAPTKQEVKGTMLVDLNSTTELPDDNDYKKFKLSQVKKNEPKM